MAWPEGNVSPLTALGPTAAHPAELVGVAQPGARGTEAPGLAVYIPARKAAGCSLDSDTPSQPVGSPGHVEGKEGDAARASRSAFSLVSSSDVLSTVPPVPFNAANTLSPATFLISTNSAALPG